MTGPTYEHPAAHPPPPRHPLHDVRAAAAIVQARPAYAAGLRAGIATVVPLLIDRMLATGGGTWVSLAGLNGALNDRGGPYRSRAIVLAAVTVVSAVVVFLGSVLASHPYVAIPVVFAIGTVCGLMRVWPEIGPGLGVTTLVTFTIALAIPAASVGDAAMRAMYIAIGGLWSMVIALIVWPLRPYRPVRLAVAACYRAVANYVEGATVASRTGARDPWAFKTPLVAVRESLEVARAALATMRRGRSGESRRGERLLMLHELADQLYAHVIALSEVVDGSRGTAISADQRQSLADAAQKTASALRAIADGIESERDLPRVSVDWNGAAFGDARDPNHAQIASLLDRSAEYASLAAAFASTLTSGDPVPDVDETLDVGKLRGDDAAILSLSAMFRPDSVVLQHALRVGLVTALAVLITTLLHLDHGYWVTLTAVVILQPYVGATRQKALQRVVGTIIGGMVAAGLSALFGGTAIVIVLIFAFTSLCIAFLPVNYGAYSIFGTPAFVLLAESSIGNWHLAGTRVINTMIGGVLALLGSRLLWPVDEWNRLPEYIASAVRADAEFLRKALDVAREGGARMFGALRDVRRAIALSAANAEDSFQRLLGDHSGPVEELEPIMACLVYTRRFSAATAGLALAGDIDASTARVELDRFAAVVIPVMHDLADAIASGRAPAPLPDALADIRTMTASPSPLHARMRRVARQAKLLHDAVDRWMARKPQLARG